MLCRCLGLLNVDEIPEHTGGALAISLGWAPTMRIILCGDMKGGLPLLETTLSVAPVLKSALSIICGTNALKGWALNPKLQALGCGFLMMPTFMQHSIPMAIRLET